MIGVLTASERAHEAFHRQMEEEGVSIEYTPGALLIPHSSHCAYFTGSPEGLVGYGPDAESAYLHLMELAEEATTYAAEQVETARSLEQMRD